MQPSTPSGWRYTIPVALVAALGLGLTGGFVDMQRHLVAESADEVADQTISEAAEQAGQSLGALKGSTRAVTGLFAVQRNVSHHQYGAFVRRVLGGSDDVDSVQFAPRITSNRRGDIRTRFAKSQGPAVSTGTGSTDQAASGRRREYLPIMYSEPLIGHEQAIGLDLLSDPTRRAIVVKARDTGQAQVSEFRQTYGDAAQLVIYTPAYRNGRPPPTVRKRRAQWTGVALTSIRVSDWMQAAATHGDPDLTSMMLTDSREDPPKLLWSIDGTPLPENPELLTSRAKISISDDQDLVVAGFPAPELLATQGWWRPLAALLAGLLFTFMLCFSVWKWLDARRIRRTANDLQQATNRLRFLAERDPLTGLPHRDGLHSWLDEWSARNPERSLAFLFIDLDGFKEVNTAWGHPTGDLVLRQIAERLSVLSGDPDSIVARLGSDEFVVARAVDRGSIDGLATMVVTLVAEPIPIGDRDVQFTSSVGIAVRPEDGSTLDSLLVNADIAVREAKKQPADSVVRFDPVMAAQGASRRQLARSLRIAMRHPDRNFFLEYQPQIDMRTGSLVGVEALVRWHETGRLISPLEFVPLAREHGLMQQLGSWVLESACKTVAEWRKSIDAVVSINVDTAQLTGDFATVVSTVLGRCGVAPEWLIVEVTEGAAMTRDASRELDHIRALGVNIAIDDFGTGFSSLSRLADLPTHQLKIDRAFVSGLGESAESREIVRTIVALADSLGLETMAEGVETAHQAEILLEEGVYYAQGFLFARPLPPDLCLQMWSTGIAMPQALARH